MRKILTNFSFDDRSFKEKLNTIKSKCRQHQKSWKIKSSELVALFLISMLFVALQIQNSIAQGNLAVAFTFDDVWYFKDALLRVRDSYNGQFFQHYISNPPHAPLASFFCMIGIFLFGTVNWGPSLVLGLTVFAAILFTHYLTRNLSAIFRWFIIMLMLGWPIMTHLFIELRPDVVCGFLTVVVVFLILDQNQWYLDLKRSFIIGVIFALALLAKVSISPFTITTVALTAVVTLVRDYKILKLQQFEIKNLIKPFFCFIVPVLLLALPHYILSFDHLVTYLYNGFVTEKKIWDLPLTLKQEARFYIWGYGGKFMMGKWSTIAWILITLGILTWIWKSKNKKSDFIHCASFFAVLLYIYLGATIPSMKSPFLGVAISWFILFGSVKMYSYTLEFFSKNNEFNIQNPAHLLTTIATIVIFCETINWSFFQRTIAYEHSVYSMREYQDTLFHKERMDKIISTLLDYRGKGPVTNDSKIKVFNSGVGPYLNGDTMTIELLKRERIVGDRALDFEFSEVTLSDDWNRFQKGIDSADIILAFSADDPEYIRLQTIEDRRADVLKYLCKNNNFLLRDSFTKTLSPGETYIFLKQKKFQQEISLDKKRKKELCNKITSTKKIK